MCSYWGNCHYRWVALEWSICRAICGGGIQRRYIECRQVNGMGLDQKINDSDCISSLRPIESQRCNTHPCGTWKVSTWGQCSHSCGIGVRNRSVICIGENEKKISDINCQHLKKPSIIEPCNKGQCHYYWRSEPWSSVSCCYYKYSYIIEKYCYSVIVVFLYDSVTIVVVMEYKDVALIVSPLIVEQK